MQFLLTSFFLLFVFSSCSLKTTEGLREIPKTQTGIENPYFSETSRDYVYKAKIDIYGKYFGGILILKKVGDRSHRVVFTTEFGNKIFDFLFEGDTFTKNYILEDLDKKIILNTLEKDFKLLITETVKVEAQFASEIQTVYKAEADKRYNFYFFTTLPIGQAGSEGILERIVQTSKVKEKVEIVFIPFDVSETELENVAKEIAINHQNIKLTIHLDYLKTK